MKKIFLFAAMLPMMGVAEQITGAFGIKLGEPIGDVRISDETDILSGMFVVIPPSPITLFDIYSVRIIPSDNIVASINAFNTFDSMLDCTSNLSPLKKALEDKYSMKYGCSFR